MNFATGTDRDGGPGGADGEGRGEGAAFVQRIVEADQMEWARDGEWRGGTQCAQESRKGRSHRAHVE